MKTRFLIFISILLLATLACNSILPSNDVSTLPTAPFNPQIQSDVPRTEDDVPRISLSEAKAAVDSGQAIFVDVRSAQAYSELHATGAISIPLDVFETNINSIALEKTDWIITYCTWPSEHTSARAAFLLLHNGYENVQALLGGFEAWVNAGYPTEP